MLSKIWTALDRVERNFRRSWGQDLETPSGRRWARLHYHLFDHAFLRVFWTNFWPVSDGVWRSNQPTEARFRRYARMGVRTIVNLRGADALAPYRFEREACEALGLTLVDVRLHARRAVERHWIVAVIDALRAAERPIIFHCKSGADRAGFVAAMYQMVFDEVPVEQARRQLALKYVHLEFTKTGVQGYILDVYAARLEQGDIGFEDWIRTEYENQAIQQGFDAGRAPVEVAKALAANPLP